LGTVLLNHFTMVNIISKLGPFRPSLMFEGMV